MIAKIESVESRDSWRKEKVGNGRFKVDIVDVEEIVPTEPQRENLPITNKIVKATLLYVVSNIFLLYSYFVWLVVVLTSFLYLSHAYVLSHKLCKPIWTTRFSHVFSFKDFISKKHELVFRGKEASVSQT